MTLKCFGRFAAAVTFPSRDSSDSFKLTDVKHSPVGCCHLSGLSDGMVTVGLSQSHLFIIIFLLHSVLWVMMATLVLGVEPKLDFEVEMMTLRKI